MNNTRYIYALYPPEQWPLVYIGQTNDPKVRFWRYLAQPHNADLTPWIMGLKANGQRPAMDTFCTVDKKYVDCAEAFWAFYFRGFVKGSPFELRIYNKFGYLDKSAYRAFDLMNKGEFFDKLTFNEDSITYRVLMENKTSRALINNNR